MAFMPQPPQFPSHHTPYGAPLSFQPQSTWGGIDYYRAHALNPETSLYEDAWGRVRDRTSIMNNSLGVGMDEARHLHRRAYDIPGEINHMPPAAIGQAAAYEAYNSWLRNSSIYEIVGEDRERQREGLVGVAVAEVTRLLQYSAHQLDRYAQSMAADAAAHTVTVLFYQGQEDYPRSRSRMRAPSYAGSQIIDPVDPLWSQPITPSRSRSRSRSRYSHRHYSASPSPHRRHRSRSRAYDEYYDVGPIPSQMSYSSSYAGYPGSQAGYHTPYSTAPMLSNPMYPSSSYPTQLAQTPYPGQPMAMSTSYPTPLYPGPSVMTVPPRRNSFGYPTMQYPGTAWSGSAAVPSQAPTVVIMESKRKHRHHRHK